MAGDACMRASAAVAVTAVLVWARQQRNRRHVLTRDAEFHGKQRCILITGAASGIGLATARFFAQRGWFVGMYDINDVQLERCASSVRSIDDCPGVAYGKLDQKENASCEEAVKHFLSQTNDGRLDCLFNCAGLLRVGLFEEMSLDKQLEQVRVNFDGVCTMTHASLPALKKTPWSSIVNMASASAFYGIPSFAVYSATKHAVHALTEAWSIEFEQHGIHVADICAPLIATPMVAEQSKTDLALMEKTPSITAEDVAEVVWTAVNEDTRTHHNVTLGNHLVSKFFNLDRLLSLGVVRASVRHAMLPDRCKARPRL